MTVMLRAPVVRQRMTPDDAEQRPARFSLPLRVALAVLLIAGAFFGGIALRSRNNAIPTPTSLKVDDTATVVMFKNALALQQAGKLNEARLTYLKILKDQPLNKFAYYDLGDLYQSVGQSNDAAAAYEKALLIDPNYSPALFNLAVLDTATDPNGAIRLYKHVEKVSPKLASAYFNLGLLYLHINNTKDGDAQLIKAVALDPSLYSHIPPNLIPKQIANGATIPK